MLYCTHMLNFISNKVLSNSLLFHKVLLHPYDPIFSMGGIAKQKYLEEGKEGILKFLEPL